MENINNEVKLSDLELLSNVSPKLTTKVLYEILVKVANRNDVTLNGWNRNDSENKKGDSYLSVIYRLTILGSLNDGSKQFNVPVIIKSFPKNIGRQKTYRSADFFETEIKFYEAWEKILEFQKEKQIDIFNKIPRCLACLTDGKNDFLVLEDISPQGYRGINRSIEFDLDSCKLIMRLFAGFHSTSFAFKIQHPDEYHNLVTKIKETYFAERYRKWYKGFMESLFIVWSDALNKEVPDSIYEKKFQEFINNDFYGQIINIVERKTPYSVICQGDAWVPNFLLKCIDNKPKAAFLIDFQLARDCSMATDLLFFIFSCIDSKLRTKHWDDLINEYHTEFIRHITALGCNEELFPLSALYEEIKACGKFGMGMSLEAVPFSMINDNDVADLDSIQGDEAVDISTIWIVKPLDTKEKRQRLISVFKEHVDRGFI